TTTTASTASTSTSTTATSSTTTTGALPRPEGPWAPARSGEEEGPAGALLCRQGSTRSRQAFAAPPGRRPVAEARSAQAPRVPGEHGRRQVGQPEITTTRGPPQGGPLSLGPVRFGRYVAARKIPSPRRVLRAKGSNNQRRVSERHHSPPSAVASD